MCLSRVLTPFQYQYFRYLLSKDNFSVKKSDKRRFFILLAADYGNVGDIAITIAQKEIVENHFDYEVVLMPSTSCYDDLKSLVNNVGKNDIISFVGGGNCGDLYFPYEIYRQLTMDLLVNNIVVVFPQSVKFEKKNNLKRAQRHYKKKRDKLYFFTREIYSFDFFESNFLYNNVSCLPDVVFTMDKFAPLLDRKDVMLCLRDDKERLLTDEDKTYLINSINKLSYNWKLKDTYKNIVLSLNQIDSYLNSFIDELSLKRLLITDRLHGMILGFVTGTPTIVLPNNNQKIRGSYQFIKDCDYIHFIENLDGLEELIAKMIKVKPSYKYFSLKRDMFVKEYVEALTPILQH